MSQEATVEVHRTSACPTGTGSDGCEGASNETFLSESHLTCTC